MKWHRSKARLQLQIPRRISPVRPFYVEYRLLDMDVREMVAEFGALVLPIAAAYAK